jgi:hypothetical protein
MNYDLLLRFFNENDPQEIPAGRAQRQILA